MCTVPNLYQYNDNCHAYANLHERPGDWNKLVRHHKENKPAAASETEQDCVDLKDKQ